MNDLSENSVKAQKALDYFTSGCNCSQSVFASFHEEMGMTEEDALRLTSSMGGGIGGLREVCGAVTGMCLALGALKGYAYPPSHEEKEKHYAFIRRKAAEFQDVYGTLICRELLEKYDVKPSPAPAKRTAEYYKTRPCAGFVQACARFVEEELNK